MPPSIPQRIESPPAVHAKKMDIGEVHAPSRTVGCSVKYPCSPKKKYMWQTCRQRSACIVQLYNRVQLLNRVPDLGFQVYMILTAAILVAFVVFIELSTDIV